MAWTAPKTWTASTVLTAAELNEQIRDNLTACTPSQANNERGYMVTKDLNQIVQRIARKHSVLATESTTAVSYTDLATIGPTIEVETGQSALAIFACQGNTTTAGFSWFMDLEVSGATDIPADSDNALRHNLTTSANRWTQCSQFRFYTELNPGFNTFTAKYCVGGSTGNFTRRRMVILPF